MGGNSKAQLDLKIVKNKLNFLYVLGEICTRIHFNITFRLACALLAIIEKCEVHNRTVTLVYFN